MGRYLSHAVLNRYIQSASQAINYLREHQLFTLEDLDTALQGVNEKARTINADIKKASARMKVITGIQNAVADCQTHKAVHAGQNQETAP